MVWDGKGARDRYHRREVTEKSSCRANAIDINPARYDIIGRTCRTGLRYNS